MAREAAANLGHRLRRLLRAPLAGLQHLWQGANPAEGPEPPDVATGRVLAIVFGWAVFVAVAIGGFGWYTLNRVQLASPAQNVDALPAPRLQVDPAADYDRLTAAQNARLASYAWVDRAAGTVRIPIERAMALIVAKGPAAFAPLRPAAPDSPRARAVDAATRAGASR